MGQKKKEKGELKKMTQGNCLGWRKRWRKKGQQ